MVPSGVLVALLLPQLVEANCPDWCNSWTCDGSAWCADGSMPDPCSGCRQPHGTDAHTKGRTNCPNWCRDWSCSTCDVSLCTACAQADAPVEEHNGLALGPVRPGSAGWAIEHARSALPSVSDSIFHVIGDTRAYLVEKYTGSTWADHRYVRFDLTSAPLVFEVDLSNVCACLHLKPCTAPCTAGFPLRAHSEPHKLRRASIHAHTGAVRVHRMRIPRSHEGSRCLRLQLL